MMLGLAAPASTQAQTLLQEQPQPETLPDAPPVGWQLAPGLTVSGYATGQFLAPLGDTELPDNPGDVNNTQFSRRARFNLSHLSAIAWWEPAADWKLLGEIDLQNIAQLPSGSGAQYGAAASAYVALERVYADYRATDALTLRAGKFLTPIGHWNQDHSDPQTWTVLRPLISQAAFPTSVTGLMAFGSLPMADQWLDYQLYASNGGEWRPSPWTHPFDSAFGGRLSTSLNPDFKMGVSLSRFFERETPGNEFLLAGVDAAWTLGRAELSMEAMHRRSPGGQGGERGWFLQGALPVAGRWWLTGRQEYYRRDVDGWSSRSTLIGAVYKGVDHWTFKIEWVQLSARAVGQPAGLLSSLTLAF
ncbi:hypothetical protein [Ideonella azotifigens]|uniref:hypothetical protein n=1 Tax=Ideonella azotifigens TaxID=513160 RepID=UPI0031DEBC6A